jgi:hypothetical protein
MWHSSLRKRNRGGPTKRRDVRLALELLEDRLVPTNYTAGNVNQLIADINAANQAGGSNTITLTAPTTSPYVLTAVDNSTDGANGLPVIAKYNNLTIVGNGDTIERSLDNVPSFRLFDVASGSSLTLENLTLQHGFAVGSGAAAEGGALYNQGSLVLNGVTVANNQVVGSTGPRTGPAGLNGGNGSDAAGGGIWSNGVLTLENGTLVQSNGAFGGDGGDGNTGRHARGKGGNGGDAFGGGLYVAGGTVTLTSSTLSNNFARGGNSGFGPGGYGVAGNGYGGGLYVAHGTVTLDAFTVNNTINNTATFYPNIYGSYSLL